MFVPLSFRSQIPLLRAIFLVDPKPKGTNPKGTKENSLRVELRKSTLEFVGGRGPTLGSPFEILILGLGPKP